MPLATVGTTIQVRSDYQRLKGSGQFYFQAISPQPIANFRLFPGFSTDILAYLLKKPIKGLILETYGAGNAQNNDKKFLNCLKKAIDEGVIIVNCTQCIQGRVMMNQYETGNTLLSLGLISGHNMTSEAAHCKLLYLLSKDLPTLAIKQAMCEDMSGELDYTQSTSKCIDPRAGF